MNFESATPNPEYLIKSIAEQGYSLETSLADLIDNSISAQASSVEILVDMNHQPYTLFLADDGDGMSEDALGESMKFPSASPESNRTDTDMGRFGLGMKTASFSQTRKVTVLSREKGTERFAARTWDVDFLKKEEAWHLIVNSDEEILELLSRYHKISEAHLNRIDDFNANTIIVWGGLYKFEEHLEECHRKASLSRQIHETTKEHLSLVFHRFLEDSKKPLKIRINNTQLKGFNPFPGNPVQLRSVTPCQREFRDEHVKLEGFVLPSCAISDVKKGRSYWTTKYRSLTDMEGIYVYRANRLILFGGWNGLIKKGPRLQLARLRLDMGNKADHYFHLNVAKSQICIPPDLRDAFKDYVQNLQVEAQREFFNRDVRKLSGDKKEQRPALFSRVASSKGTLLELNFNYPLLEQLESDLTKVQRTQLKLLVRMINTSINKIRQTHEEKPYSVLAKDGVNDDEVILLIRHCLDSGYGTEFVRKELMPTLGVSAKTLPEEIKLLFS